MTFRLYRYLIRKFLITLFYISLFLGVIIIIFELIGTTKSGFSFLEALTVVGFNFMSKVYTMLPYSSLASTVILFFQMRQNKEWVAYKHLGFSNKQVMASFLFLLCCYMILDIFALNPISTKLDYEVRQIETLYDSTLINFSSSGIWLRDTDLNEYRYIQAQKIIPKENAFEDVKMLILNKDGQLNSYWHIKKAILKNNEWQLIEAQNLEDQTYSESFKKTVLTPSDLHVVSKQVFIPFIELPSHIKLFKKLNLATDYYYLLLNHFLAQYLYLFSMIMMGFFIGTLVLNRVYMFMGTLFTGLSVFFLSEFILSYITTYHVDKFYILWIFPSFLTMMLWKRL